MSTLRSIRTMILVGSGLFASLSVWSDMAVVVNSAYPVYSKLANKNPAQMNAYWSKLIFTGQGQPPKAVGGDADVVSLVATNPSMIGYVHASAVHKGVKVIAKVPE